MKVKLNYKKNFERENNFMMSIHETYIHVHKKTVTRTQTDSTGEVSVLKGDVSLLPLPA